MAIFSFSLPMFSISLFAFAAFAVIIVKFRGSRLVKQARGRVLNGSWICADDLAAGCAEDGEYRKVDGPGCYIITIFDHEVADGDYGSYREVYVGRSENVYEGACSKVERLISGGDAQDGGDALNDHDGGDEQDGGDAQCVESGSRHAYIQIRPCEERKLIRHEQALIKVMKAHKR